MTDRYAVIGNPVAHSRSPEIHAAFAHATDQDMIYTRLLAPLDTFAQTLTAFRTAGDGGARGVNVTVPFKQEAFQFATAHSARARAAGAANTLRFDGETVYADNTDGVGLVRDITQNVGVGIAGKRVLLLGAGGAARGVVGALLAESPVALTINNRTIDKARAVIADWRQNGSNTAPNIDFSVLTADQLAHQQYDIVINATSSSLQNAQPELPLNVFADDALAYDMMYASAPTLFLQSATRAGARTADGLGMLVEQAAEAFFVWRQVRPRTNEVLAQLRASLSAAAWH